MWSDASCMDEHEPPPGWYPNPADSKSSRYVYWNGTEWEPKHQRGVFKHRLRVTARVYVTVGWAVLALVELARVQGSVDDRQGLPWPHVLLATVCALLAVASQTKLMWLRRVSRALFIVAAFWAVGAVSALSSEWGQCNHGADWTGLSCPADDLLHTVVMFGGLLAFAGIGAGVTAMFGDRASQDAAQAPQEQ